MKQRLVLVTAAILLAACSSTTPKTHYYTLSAENPTAVSSSHAASSVIVGPVHLPELLDQPRLVVRNSNNQVAMDEFHRWAGSLKGNIASVLVSNLAQDLGTAKVWSYAQSTRSQADYQVLIDIQAFDAHPGERVELVALWTIRAATGGKPQTGRSVVREAVAGPGFEALVAAHSRALAKLSSDIAQAIRQG
ncbi:MAG: membrane integrity-associated transporter subunit PqiC [Zoogloeaceae bacterium]|nr:membrane integrity-associated transporter subunit PqiC [Zoogloeaceae bacterium]